MQTDKSFKGVSTNMYKNAWRIFSTILIGIFLTNSLFAQDSKKASSASSLYVISAKAGAVNFVSGKVSLETNAGKKGTLQKTDTVETGDKVSTATDGKVEVLLNPGSYIRIAENSEFEFISTSLDDLQVKVNKGSAILEVIADKDFRITVKLPNSKFYLISEGVFRIDVLENGDGKISVWKGKAQVGDINATIIKKGKTATQNGSNVVVAKFDRDVKTDLENWSRDRAKEIAKINAKLQQKAMTVSLFNSFQNRSFGMSNGYGVWVQDPFSRSYCFLPFGYGWSSPYGFGYNRSIWSYQLPYQITNQVYQNPNLNNPNNNNQNPPMTPPTTYPSNGGNNGNNGGNNGGSQPVYQPPVREERPTRENAPRTDRPNKQERDQPRID
jgi:hypothetical protein